MMAALSYAFSEFFCSAALPGKRDPVIGKEARQNKRLERFSSPAETV
jgi:hypothetical protein